MLQRQTQSKTYWADEFTISKDDVEFVNNLILERESPVSNNEIALKLIQAEIDREEIALQKQSVAEGAMYRPELTPEVGAKLVFTELDYVAGEVVGTRKGSNPDTGTFQVITVKLDDGETREFVAGMAAHALNETGNGAVGEDAGEATSADWVLKKYRKLIDPKLAAALEMQDMVQLGSEWYPPGMLMEITDFHLNLVEALLDMEDGGPKPTDDLLEPLDLQASDSKAIRTFSLNYAMLQDDRFDEVGPAGEVLWYLRSYEPDDVRKTPMWLRHDPFVGEKPLTSALQALAATIDDELSEFTDADDTAESVQLALTYPHVRAGTLPLTARIQHMFPIAYSAPRILITLIDTHTGERLPGWIVQNERYVSGLGLWYEKYGVMPGSLVQLRLGKVLGEVEVQIMRQRTKRDWVRTLVVENDRVQFALEQQGIQTHFEDESVLYVHDPAQIDALWTAYGKRPLAKVVGQFLGDLSRLTVQSQVHAKTLYTVVNAVRRVTPEDVFAALLTLPNAVHVGDAYWSLETDKS